MYRQMFSLSLLQKNINDAVRSSAASEVAASTEGDGAECIYGQSPSSKLAGPKYLVLGLDPCEDPTKVYIDVVIKKCIGFKPLLPEWERVFSDLWEIGAWKRNPATNVSFVTRLDPVPAPVELPQWQQSIYGFARRLTLKELCSLLLRSGIVKSKSGLFDLLFEMPHEIVSAGGMKGLANRARFTKTSLIEWFFSFDTYSKCILFFEVVCWYLATQASPVMLFLDDVFCEVFSHILRPTYITRIKASVSYENLLAPTLDTRLVPLTEFVENFLRTPIVIRGLLASDSEYKFIDGVTVPPTSDKTDVESVKSILRGEDRHGVDSSSSSPSPDDDDDEDDDEDDDDDDDTPRADRGYIAVTKRKAPLYRGPFQKSSKSIKRFSHTIQYSTIEGHQSGSLSPLTIHVRSEPIVPHTHNHLLFPVFSSDNPGAEILFFVRPKLTAAVALLTPGVFNRKGNYLCGECPSIRTSPKTTPLTVAAPQRQGDVWRYTLADYCPLRHYTEEMLRPPTTSGDGTRTSDLKHLDVQPLCF
uniref:Wsv415-like protein n=1 Tax=Metapenaeus ensis nimavirus TaxID=2133794 RepID=A0A401IPD8_9VIRU|nr:MAG: wsv415-like protein [Metapenaeus ensis nimavirus]GBG35484.1 wsv415-like protein [Metapenaeus ensis nimavirus]